MKGFLEFCFIKNRETGTDHRSGVFIAVAWLDVTFRMTRLACNLLGEIEPTANSLIGEMIDTFVPPIQSFLKYRGDGHSQIAGIGGRAHLVENNGKHGLAIREVQHGFAEVLAILAIEPCSTEDDVTAT